MSEVAKRAVAAVVEVLDLLLTSQENKDTLAKWAADSLSSRPQSMSVNGTMTETP